MKRATLLSLLITLGLSACGSSSDVSYLPSAWGPSGYCYYVISPYECYGHHYGTPTLMPLWWHQRYAAYYDSPAYVGAYVPRSYRSTATTRARVFERTYASSIKTQSRAATWRGSNGRTVPGTKVGRSATYGAGSARSTGFSGGSVRRSSSPCAALPSHYFVAALGSSFSGGGGRSSFSGGSSGSSGRSYSGGSARSGGPSSSSSRRSSGGGRNC